MIDDILAQYEPVIGDDFPGYRGHCQRLLQYMTLLGMPEEESSTAAVLLPFHDLGIWTDGTMDYLGPSIREANDYIHRQQLAILPELVQAFIGDHHKLSRASGRLPELLRRADLIDLSFGLIRFGVTREDIRAVQQAFPHHGFQWKVYRKTLAWAVRHWRRPFPMVFSS